MTAEVQADGTLAFRLRFRAYGGRQAVFLHERRDCECECGGGWNERTARVELRKIIARVEAGVWQKPTRREAERSVVPAEIPLFDDYIEYWLTARFDGVLGGKPLDANTRGDYRWRAGHLKRFFGRYRLDEIDGDLCLALKAHKLREAQELRERLQAGADLRDARNRRMVPLGAASLKKLLTMLTAVLGDAIEDGHLDANPARSRRLRVHVPKPKRAFLEIDELACLLDAAREQDPPLALFRQAAIAAPAGSTRAAVALAVSEGKSQAAVVRELGLAKSSVSYHLNRACRCCRTRPPIRCAAPTSRSRSWQTTSTSCGS